MKRTGETLDEFRKRVAPATANPRTVARIKAIFEAPLPPLPIDGPQEQAS